MATASPLAQNVPLGIVLKLCAVTLFMIMSSLVKAASDTVPPGEAVFFRAFFALPVILAWLALRGELRAGLKTRNPWGHLWRGLLGSTAMGLMFTGLALLPLHEVTALRFTTPLLVVVFAAMILGERVRAFRLSAVALGFVGVLVVLSPKLGLLRGAAPVGSGEVLGVAVTLGAAAAAALAHVVLRRLTRTEGTAAIVFWFSVTASVLALATAPFGWAWPGPRVFMLLLFAGLTGGLGQIFLTSAYRQADAGVIAPFDYASMLLALAIGYTVFGETPTLVMLAGAALVILAGILIIWRERRLGLKSGGPARAATPPG
ncbi:EamA family transporter [Maritimibacter sp. 55A14]|uniref:DMT family transporter n=1 Tax=Maritimibacter sp. 55A14 TaxID=2174844 RepID=UPI000D62147A|nr:DMT family transporter [Maritimibacter sp. 55A14]PWE29329.1 EamA family transporter [Maritimibacter sp. 55A14]